jgi:septum formation protein
MTNSHPAGTGSARRPTRFVLASASPARLGVLQAAGIDPDVLVSGIDEDAVLAAHSGSGPHRAVAALAEAKADAVLGSVPAEVAADAVVIGCDSMLLLDDKLLGKPVDAKRARQAWAAMAGRSGDLLTGHAVIRLIDGIALDRAVTTAVTHVHVGSPSSEELSAYLETGEPFAVAGALTIDGYGGWFVDGVTGDPSNVIGLSLPTTRELLARLGIRVTDLWRRL